MNKFNIRETISGFKPTWIFLGKFLLIYFLGNIGYSSYITYYHPDPDPATILVARQTAFFLQDVETRIAVNKPSISLLYNSDVVINVYEGCNGINVMIVFLAFIIALPDTLKKTILYLVGGLFIVYLVNIIRVLFLYYAALYIKEYFYYFHKYIFTGLLYVIVFILWYGWIRISRLRNESTAKN